MAGSVAGDVMASDNYEGSDGSGGSGGNSWSLSNLNL
jgi:hypothetical protein